MVIEKYISIDKQAEDIDTSESYKEDVELIISMNYEELYNIIRDTELALKVLVGGELKNTYSGIIPILERIKNLIIIYLSGLDINLDNMYEKIGKDRVRVE